MKKGISKIYQMRSRLGGEPLVDRFTYEGPIVYDAAREARVIEHTERVQAHLAKCPEPNGNTIVNISRPTANAIRRRLLKARRKAEAA